MWEVHRIFNLFPRRSRQLSRKRAFGLPPCGPRARTPACPSYGLEDDAAAHYAAPSFKGNAPDVDAECRRYEQLLREAPITLCMLGFGENGHIAFNDPHVANFQDPQGVKRVDLDERDRRQQAGEGHFPGWESVPREAITLTCPMLMGSENIIGCVPELRKAEAVKNALEGPVSTKCPGSVVRTHPQAHIYLDADSASLLKK